MDEDLIQLGLFLFFVVGFIVIRLLRASSSKEERRRPSAPPVSYGYSPEYSEPRTADMPGDFMRLPPIPDADTPAKHRATPAPHPRRKAIKAPSDLREAIIWGEILKRKF